MTIGQCPFVGIFDAVPHYRRPVAFLLSLASGPGRVHPAAPAAAVGGGHRYRPHQRHHAHCRGPQHQIHHQDLDQYGIHRVHTSQQQSLHS